MRLTSLRAGRILRTAMGATVAGLFAVGIVPQHASAVTAPTPFVNLRGVGTWGTYQQLVAWENDLGAASKPVYMSYTSHGAAVGLVSLRRVTMRDEGGRPRGCWNVRNTGEAVT